MLAENQESCKNVNLPFDPDKIYGKLKWRTEDYLLDTEAKGKLRSGEARIRFFTDFIFVKDKQVVFPLYENCDKDWWEGVEAYGYMQGATSGIQRWTTWSLLWALGTLEVVPVRLDHVIGISKERNTAYRNGNECALWLNTRARNSYVLMEPDESIAPGWLAVILSWQGVGGDELSVCRPAAPERGVIPSWWKSAEGEVAGKQAWQRLVAAWRRQQAEEHDDNNDAGSASEDAKEKGAKPAEDTQQGRSGGLKRRRSSTKGQKGSGDAVATSAAKAKSSKPVQPVPSSTPTAPSTSAAAIKPKQKSRAWVDLSDDEEPRFPPSGQVAPSPPAVEEPSQESTAQAATVPSPPSSHPESSGPASEYGASPERPAKRARSLDRGGSVPPLPDLAARRGRVFREAQPGYEPGLETQRANLLPLLTNAPAASTAEELEAGSSQRRASAPPQLLSQPSFLRVFTFCSGYGGVGVGS
ncbi:hypothetical protein RhiJN_02579 [Ceratobasidium sp. AG-Ba]|nr:hypothetical protein RhiJN_02579 [Ceratobasidium sp. AG-Ba]